MLTHGKGKRAITALYTALQALDVNRAPQSKLKWERALNKELSIKQWEMAMEQTKRVSRNARLKFTHFNYLHLTYLTPHRLTECSQGRSQTVQDAAILMQLLFIWYGTIH